MSNGKYFKISSRVKTKWAPLTWSKTHSSEDSKNCFSHSTSGTLNLVAIIVPWRKMERWLNLKLPASFSSKNYLLREIKTKKRKKEAKKELNKSIVFQAHRSLPDKFKTRTNFATFKNERIEKKNENIDFILDLFLLQNIPFINSKIVYFIF